METAPLHSPSHRTRLTVFSSACAAIDGGDHASKFMALSPPPIDVIAEAKRIMKRARADDEQHSVDKAKWRQVEFEAEAMSSDGDDNAHEYFYDSNCSQFDSCEEDMEAQGVRGQGVASELIAPSPVSTPRDFIF